MTTIAPTGSISIIADASSGIEPIFAVAYRHIVKNGSLNRTLTFFNKKLEGELEKAGISLKNVKDKILEQGTIRDIKEIPENVRKIFGTAHEIQYDWHIKTQAVFQKYTENAVSKTINLINSCTVQEIKNSYLLAWKVGCKGITVFRDGCKKVQVLNSGLESKKKLTAQTELAIQRPFVANGSTYKINTPVGVAFITINEDNNGDPMEVFINVGKAGSDVTAMAEALGRTISIALRFRGELTAGERAKEIAEQLAGIGGRRSVGFGPNKILSLPDAISFAISNHFDYKVNGFYSLDSSTNTPHKEHSKRNDGIEDKIVDKILLIKPPQKFAFTIQNEISDPEKRKDLCPACGISAFVYQEGCSKCYACGYSEC